jgi:hypothetical protein
MAPALRRRRPTGRRGRRHRPAPIKPVQCPSCGSARVATILYGLPAFGPELDRQLETGEIVLGGCCVSDEMPEWRWAECGQEWGTVTFG